MGIPVARTSTLVWGIAAAFTATTIIVLAAVQFVTPLGAANGTAQLTLGYPVLVKALLIAMIARMRILWLTIPVGMALGIVEVIFQQNVHRGSTRTCSRSGCSWRRSSSCSRSRRSMRGRRPRPSRRGSSSGRVKPLPERVRGIWAMRQLPRFGVVAVLARVRGHPRVRAAGVAVVPLDARRDLRDRRLLAHDPERMGGSALARPVRVLGHRRPRHRAHGRRRAGSASTTCRGASPSRSACSSAPAVALRRSGSRRSASRACTSR